MAEREADGSGSPASYRSTGFAHPVKDVDDYRGTGAALVSALELARWQFGVTTVYHFLFVPITIGITWFVALSRRLARTR